MNDAQFIHPDKRVQDRIRMGMLYLLSVGMTLEGEHKEMLWKIMPIHAQDRQPNEDLDVRTYVRFPHTRWFFIGTFVSVQLTIDAALEHLVNEMEKRMRKSLALWIGEMK